VADDPVAAAEHLLKLGRDHLNCGMTAQGKAKLRDVIAKHPNTKAARKAAKIPARYR
jgi:TolA-binding protein